MPTAKGFTGQRADAATGLDYYGARYYDPVAGQFTSADTVADGLSPYAYVRGNPETLTDPTGHRYACPDNDCGGGDGGNSPASQSPGTGGGTEPKGCNAHPYQCQIRSFFQQNDPRYAMLMYLANSHSEIGHKLLGFILFMCATIGGDKYLRLGDLGADTGGVTSFETGDITINSSFYFGPDKNNWDVLDAASVLIHEATESYFVIEHGFHHGATGSYRGDYVAQWFRGEFESQDINSYGFHNFGATNSGHYEAYGMTYAQWEASGDFMNYANREPSVGIESWVYGFSPAAFWIMTQSGYAGTYDIPELDAKTIDMLGEV